MTRLPILLPLVLLAAAGSARAQTAAAAPPPAWKTSASLGLTITGGNSETSTLNAGYDLTYDPKRRNVVKSEGLLIRGKTDGELSSSRVSLSARDEYRLTPRFFVFGQTQYLRDRFKEIDYLVAPSVGLGVRIVDTGPTTFSVDAGVGGVWEKDRGRPVVHSSGAITAGEKFTRTLTDAVGVTQTFTGLWKTSDLEDALYAFGLGLTTAIASHTQFKVEWLDTYKRRPPDPTLKKNDVSLLLALVFKR